MPILLHHLAARGRRRRGERAPRCSSTAEMTQAGRPGTDVMILKIFSPKKSAKNLAFLTQNKAKLFKNLIITLVFERNANFFAENC
jgi:hypothetical protein